MSPLQNIALRNRISLTVTLFDCLFNIFLLYCQWNNIDLLREQKKSRFRIYKDESFYRDCIKITSFLKLFFNDIWARNCKNPLLSSRYNFIFSPRGVNAIYFSYNLTLKKRLNNLLLFFKLLNVAKF